MRYMVVQIDGSGSRTLTSDHSTPESAARAAARLDERIDVSALADRWAYDVPGDVRYEIGPEDDR